MLATIAMSLLIIGHRGASGHLPENTLPAFEKAYEMGADGVELDIWPSRSGTPMVIHDEDLKRTYHQRGKVVDMQDGDLAALGVPRYTDVLEMAKGKLLIFTELKGGEENRVAEAIHHAVEQDGWDYAALPVIGFDHAQLERLKKAHPQLLIGASFSRQMMDPVPQEARVPFMISRASSLGAVAINPDYRLVTPELVERAHDAGLKVNVWTVNSTAAMDKMIALGVDSIMTDFPDRLRTRLHSRQQGAKSLP